MPRARRTRPGWLTRASSASAPGRGRSMASAMATANRHELSPTPTGGRAGSRGPVGSVRLQAISASISPPALSSPAGRVVSRALAGCVASAAATSVGPGSLSKPNPSRWAGSWGRASSRVRGGLFPKSVLGELLLVLGIGTRRESAFSRRTPAESAGTFRVPSESGGERRNLDSARARSFSGSRSRRGIDPSANRRPARASFMCVAFSHWAGQSATTRRTATSATGTSQPERVSRSTTPRQPSISSRSSSA